MKTLTSFQLEHASRFRTPKSLPAEQLRRRVDLLDHEDRILFELASSGTVGHRRIAGLLGIEPGTVTRRLQRVGARLHDPVVARLLEPRCPLSPDYRQIGVEHFLAGRTIARIANDRGVTLAFVRQAIEYVRAWHQGVANSMVGRREEWGEMEMDRR